MKILVVENSYGNWQSIRRVLESFGIFNTKIKSSMAEGLFEVTDKTVYDVVLVNDKTDIYGEIEHNCRTKCITYTDKDIKSYRMKKILLNNGVLKDEKSYIEAGKVLIDDFSSIFVNDNLMMLEHLTQCEKYRIEVMNFCKGTGKLKLFLDTGFAQHISRVYNALSGIVKTNWEDVA